MNLNLAEHHQRAFTEAHALTNSSTSAVAAIDTSLASRSSSVSPRRRRCHDQSSSAGSGAADGLAHVEQDTTGRRGQEVADQHAQREDDRREERELQRARLHPASLTGGGRLGTSGLARTHIPSKSCTVSPVRWRPRESAGIDPGFGSRLATVTSTEHLPFELEL
jgi:hypothetical protein